MIEGFSEFAMIQLWSNTAGCTQKVVGAPENMLGMEGGINSI